MQHRRSAAVFVGALAALALSSCSSSTPNGSPAPPPTSQPSSSTPIPAPTTTKAGTTSRPTPGCCATTAPQQDRAHRVFAAMSEPQRVGQLFMTGGSTTGVDDSTAAAITASHVGSVILMGSQQVSVAGVAAVSAQLQQLTGPTKLFVATDQEGGQVQRLVGPGFASIPSGEAQGQIGPSVLQGDAAIWGGQLKAAGVNLDLAPVADTVPGADFAADNPPIGQLDRQYGFDPATVAAHSTAFARGLAQAGVDATIKHFPGLGRVTANTDLSSGVTDSTTTRTDPYLEPFKTGIAAGVPFVMMSTAVYTNIDPDHPAAFSPTIIGGMLRGDLGFTGVVISDDLGGAQQVASYPVADRALNFIGAGGDLVLTVSATQIPDMTSAVLQRAISDPAFRAKVDAAALRVLAAKEARGLL